MPAIERYLRNNQPIEVARALVIINKELYRIEEEARKLRLRGELDFDIYRVLTARYDTLVRKITNLSYSYKLAHEVSVLFKALKFSNETAGIYLQEYLRGLEWEDFVLDVKNIEAMTEGMLGVSKIVDMERFAKNVILF